MKKLFVLMCTCSLLLAGCSSGTPSKGEAKTLSTNKEITLQISKKENASDFVLMKTYYQLPCSLQTFFDNGWEFIGQIEANPFVFEELSLEPKQAVVITLFKDWKQIDVQVANDSNEASLINANMMVEKVTAYNASNITADDMVFKGNVTLKTTADDIGIAYQDYKSHVDENKMHMLTGKSEVVVRVKMNYDDEEKIDNVTIAVDDKDQGMRNMLRFGENQNIDQAKNSSIDLQLSCANNLKYPPKKYKTLIADIKEGKDEIGSIKVTGKIVDKASAQRSSDLLGSSAKEIYMVEDELGNQYAFYSELSSEFTVTGLNIGDDIQIYCPYIELLDLGDDKYCPLLDAKIIYINGALVADVAGSL